MFEILEHTADIGFRATAASLAGLFESAAKALVEIAMETEAIVPRDTYSLEAEGDSPEALLVNWLNEVLYHLDGAGLAMRDFAVTSLTADRIAAQASGEPRNPDRHRGKVIIKGVTYHQLRIEQNGQGWRCEVYLDI